MAEPYEALQSFLQDRIETVAGPRVREIVERLLGGETRVQLVEALTEEVIREAIRGRVTEYLVEEEDSDMAIITGEGLQGVGTAEDPIRLADTELRDVKRVGRLTDQVHALVGKTVDIILQSGSVWTSATDVGFALLTSPPAEPADAVTTLSYVSQQDLTAPAESYSIFIRLPALIDPSKRRLVFRGAGNAVVDTLLVGSCVEVNPTTPDSQYKFYRQDDPSGGALLRDTAGEWRSIQAEQESQGRERSEWGGGLRPGTVTESDLSTSLREKVEGDDDAPYAYHLAFNITTDSAGTLADGVVVPATPVQTGGNNTDGIVMTLIPSQSAPGGLRTDRDFETHWEGDIRVNTSGSGNRRIGLTIEFAHTLASGVTFTSRREFFFVYALGREIDIPLNIFSSRTRIRTGTVNVGGTEYEILESDLESPSTIECKLILQMWHATNRTRRQDDQVTDLGFDRAKVTYQQPGLLESAPFFAPQDLGTATFDLDGTAQQIALEDGSGDAIVSPSTGYIMAVFNIPSLDLDGKVEWLSAADLRAAAVATPLASGLYTNASQEILYSAAALNSPANSSGNTIQILYLGTRQADEGITPHILRFDVTGNDAPAPGDISGERYHYELAISQSEHVGSARIVGFLGTSRDPTTVSVLKTVASYTKEAGTITIPNSTTLANAGDTYTLRLEVYEEGRQPPHDAPTRYHDFHITARAATAAVRFVRVPARISGARPTGANLLTNSTTIATRGSVFGEWEVAGIPNDGADWLIGWIVPANQSLPNQFISGGLNIDNAVADPFTLSDSSVDYQVYLFTDAASADDTYNGTKITVS